MIWKERQDFNGGVSGIVAEEMVFRLNVILTSFKSSFNPTDVAHASKFGHHLLSAFPCSKHYTNFFVCITSL